MAKSAVAAGGLPSPCALQPGRPPPRVCSRAAAATLTRHPLTFHHSHDTPGSASQVTALATIPRAKAAIAARGCRSAFRAASRNSANKGPLTMEPTLLIASRTVLAMCSTAKENAMANRPHTSVMILDRAKRVPVALEVSLAPAPGSSAGASRGTKSSRVLADKALSAESIDDMAAANRPTIASPARPGAKDSRT